MTKILRPEQVAEQLGLTNLEKFRREFRDLIGVVSGQELMDADLVEARLNDLVNPNSNSSIDHRKKRNHKSSGENLGQVKSKLLRLQKSIRKLEPVIEEAREKFERTNNPDDKLNYLQLNEKLMTKEKSLLNAQQNYDRIVRERIESIEGHQEEVKQ